MDRAAYMKESAIMGVAAQEALLQHIRPLPLHQVNGRPKHAASKPSSQNQLPVASGPVLVLWKSSTGHRCPVHPSYCAWCDVEGSQHRKVVLTA